MRSFVYEALPARVVFGAGRLAAVADEAGRLGLGRALVIASASQAAAAERIRADLGARAAGLVAEAVMHVPRERAEAARALARETAADGLIAIGGGSAVGLAKAVALALGLPILAVPTTYAGSEMTAIWGMTEAGAKTTGRDPKVLPKTVVYDPELTRDLPLRIAGPSGLNALAHSVEALYARDRNPVVALIAEESVRVMAEGLRAIAARAYDAEGRAQALYGACLCGLALGGSTMGIHHKLCHVLGGAFDLPHAETHAALLPYAAAFNAPVAAEAMAAIARALGAESAATGLWDLGRAVGAPPSLAALGLAEADLDRAAGIASAAPYPNPRPAGRADVCALLAQAWRGARPEGA